MLIQNIAKAPSMVAPKETGFQFSYNSTTTQSNQLDTITGFVLLRWIYFWPECNQWARLQIEGLRVNPKDFEILRP